MSDDGYGSVYREALKKSMEQPWRLTNKREPDYSFDRFIFIASWIAGILACVCAWIVAGHELIRRFH